MVDERQLEFLQAVWSRRPRFTYVFFGLNIFIFVLMAFAGGSTNDLTLTAFGAKLNPLIAQGQWWRFLTPIFLHIGLLHLFFNSYALWIVGPQVEKLYGPERFVLLYVLTGIAGVAGSYLYHPYTLSAGASGAIFGLFGVLLVFGIRHKESLPPTVGKAMTSGVLPIIVINLIIGFTVPAIDNAAHIGGLLAGAALAAVIPFQKPNEETSPGFRALQMTLLAGIALCFFMVAKNYDGPHLSVRNLTGGLTQVIGTRSTTQEFIDAINTAQQTFPSVSRELEFGRTDNLESLRSQTAIAIDKLRKMPSLDAKSDEITRGLLGVMQAQYSLIEDIQRAGTITFSHSRQLRENAATYEVLSRQISEWVKENGARYGITEN